MAGISSSHDLVKPDHTINEKVNYYVPALFSLGVLYFMMGFITCLNDTLVPFFKKGFDLNYTSSSLVQFYFFLTYGLMSVPAGKIVQRIGYQKGMMMGFAIAAIGACLFFPAAVYHQYALFLGALFVLAIGIVLLQVAANPYITVLGPAETASSRLTLVQGVGSIGTTVAPLFGAHFILARLEEAGSSSDAVKYPYIGIALLLIVIVLILSQLKLPVIQTAIPDENERNDGFRALFRFRNLSFGVWALFFYVGAEVAIGTFLTNYVADTLLISETAANHYVAYYWGGMLVGRIVGGFFLRAVKPSVMLTGCACLSVLLILTAMTTTSHLAVWSLVAVGLFNSVMFAIIFSLAVAGLGKYTTMASGILSTAIVGGAVIAFSLGFVKDHFSWSMAFCVPLLCYCYIIFYGINGYRQRLTS
ncbi:sugar MFS transporter [Chitinophaga defluvii]|uniref:Sugar MFS transporter n=1 Tax=Chitinophaga defluvii TaxID=3163343 RepID=A0ABV2SZ62_9BACT